MDVIVDLNGDIIFLHKIGQPGFRESLSFSLDKLLVALFLRKIPRFAFAFKDIINENNVITASRRDHGGDFPFVERKGNIEFTGKIAGRKRPQNAITLDSSSGRVFMDKFHKAVWLLLRLIIDAISVAFERLIECIPPHAVQL